MPQRPGSSSFIRSLPAPPFDVFLADGLPLRRDTLPAGRAAGSRTASSTSLSEHLPATTSASAHQAPHSIAA